MNNAIIFVKSNEEVELAKARIFDKQVIDYTVKELKRIDIDSIYLVGDLEVENTIKRNNIEEVIEELKGESGKCIVTSPFYPLIKKDDYAKLLGAEGASVIVQNNEVVPVFGINNADLANFESIGYTPVTIKESHLRRFDSIKNTFIFRDVIRKQVVNKWLNKGVIILDPLNTIIGIDVVIDKNTVIEPNVEMVGKSFIGKNNKITSGSYLNNAVIGDDNKIDSSRLINSIVHSDSNVGPNVIAEDSELLDKSSIGSYVKLIRTKVGNKVTIEHLTYLSDTNIGNDCNIGTSVVTVNNNVSTRCLTVIKDKATIGSNVSLIAPITIGESSLVAAGSAISDDVKDGDMAIARIYQQNKKGLGYKYHKEG